MCHQRERLIGYIYSEGEPRERDEVQQHLDTCVDCRAEVAGLRAVREDLLAWNVPDHESVWRPFAPAPVTPWWRQVPSWAMAAAASVMVVSGAVGGVVAHAFLPEPVTTVATRPDAAPGAPALTAADLASAEQRLLVRLRDELNAVDARVQHVSSRLQPVQLLAGADNHDPLVKELQDLRAKNLELAEVIKSFWANREQAFKEMETQDGLLQFRMSNLENAFLQLEKR